MIDHCVHKRQITRGGIALVLTLLAASPSSADRRPISIDGQFADWSGVAPALLDPVGDAGVGQVDFERVWLADDDRYLFLRFNTTVDVDLSEMNGLRLYIDGDDNPATGLAINGIGAELEWRFGLRAGTVYLPGGASAEIGFAAIELRGAPTITVSDYEIAIARNCTPGGGPLFTAPNVRVLLNDVNGGDSGPDAGQTLSYPFDQGQPVPPVQPIPLERLGPCDLRVATYNVLFDSMFEPAEQPRFARLLAAAAPDVILFQEIYDHPPEDTAALINAWLPLPSGSWTVADAADCQIASRYPILQTWSVAGNLAALLDTTAHWGRRMFVFSAHPPCCTNDFGRQQEVDQMMALLRDGVQPGGAFTLDAGTPVLIGGDMNLVGLARQLQTLLTGDISNNAAFGADFAPDWDGSSLISVLPRQTEQRMGYTWREDNNSFWPGQLDYLIYNDSVVRATRSFVMYTPEMSAGQLAAHGLQAGDSLASDHLLFVADLRLGPAIDGDLEDDGDVDLSDLARLLANFGSGPNPPASRLQGDVDGDADVDLSDLARLLANFGAACG